MNVRARRPDEPGSSVAGSDLQTRLAGLVAQAAGGDEQAFADLYDLTSARVHGVVLRVLRSADHAVEVTQEVYVEVWRQAARYDVGRGSVLAWMTTMAHRRAVDRVRSVTSQAAREEVYSVQTASREVDEVWADVEQNFDVTQVRAKMEALTPIQREALTLTYYGGLTQRQVAERLELPLGTVKTRIRAGLISLRAAMGVEA